MATYRLSGNGISSANTTGVFIIPSGSTAGTTTYTIYATADTNCTTSKTIVQPKCDPPTYKLRFNGKIHVDGSDGTCFGASEYMLIPHTTGKYDLSATLEFGDRSTKDVNFSSNITQTFEITESQYNSTLTLLKLNVDFNNVIIQNQCDTSGNRYNIKIEYDATKSGGSVYYISVPFPSNLIPSCPYCEADTPGDIFTLFFDYQKNYEYLDVSFTYGMYLYAGDTAMANGYITKS